MPFDKRSRFSILDVLSSWIIRGLDFNFWELRPTKFKGGRSIFARRSQRRGKVLRLTTSARKAELETPRRKTKKVSEATFKTVKPKEEKKRKARRRLPKEKPKEKREDIRTRIIPPERGRVEVPPIKGDFVHPFLRMTNRQIGWPPSQTEAEYAYNLLVAAHDPKFGSSNHYTSEDGWRRFRLQDGVLLEDTWVCSVSPLRYLQKRISDIFGALGAIDPFGPSQMRGLTSSQNIIIYINKTTGKEIGTELSTCYYGETKEVNPSLYVDREFSGFGPGLTRPFKVDDNMWMQNFSIARKGTILGVLSGGPYPITGTMGIGK